MTEDSAPTTTERKEAHVFIGNLTYQTRDSELKEHVEKLAGKTTDVHIVFRGPRSQGYGFVTFEDESIIDGAVEKLKDSELDGRKINAQKVVPREERPPRRNNQGRRGDRPRRPRGPPSDTMIYIGNLPFSMTTEDLTQMMAEFKVTKCHVVTRHNGSSKGFGFIHAADHAEQQRILSEMKDATCDGRVLNVRAATSEGPYGDGEAAAEEEEH